MTMLTMVSKEIHYLHNWKGRRKLKEHIYGYIVEPALQLLNLQLQIMFTSEVGLKP